MKKNKKELTVENMLVELPNIIEEKLYLARQDAWLSACEWIISLKEGEKIDCKKAFEDYNNLLKYNYE